MKSLKDLALLLNFIHNLRSFLNKIFLRICSSKNFLKDLGDFFSIFLLSNIFDPDLLDQTTETSPSAGNLFFVQYQKQNNYLVQQICNFV